MNPLKVTLDLRDTISDLPTIKHHFSKVTDPARFRTKLHARCELVRYSNNKQMILTASSGPTAP